MVTNIVITGDRCDCRKLINFTKDQNEWIRKQAFEEKVSMSEVVRKAIRKEMDTGEQPKTG